MISHSFCPYFNRGECKSCSQIEVAYETQLAQKQAKLKLLLSALGEIKFESPVASPTQGFRNKAKLSVTGTPQNPILGITGETKLDEGRALLHCPIHHPRLNELISALPDFITRYNLIPYDIARRAGELKSVILFYSEHSNELYLRFVLRSKECVSRIQKLLPELQNAFPALKVVSANLQPVPHAILEGLEEIYITKEISIDHVLDRKPTPIHLKLSPQAFVQTNSVVATQLYQKAAAWISEIHPPIMAELFCGQGPFSFFAAEAARKIVGFEINAEAVATANASAKEQGLTHLSFQTMDVARAAETVRKISPDLILVNPPRKGVGAEGVKLIQECNPEHLIYSSCNAETLAKDLGALSERYEAERAQIFDLFPHTEHFETLVYLRRRGHVDH